MWFTDFGRRKGLVCCPAVVLLGRPCTVLGSAGSTTATLFLGLLSCSESKTNGESLSSSSNCGGGSSFRPGSGKGGFRVMGILALAVSTTLSSDQLRFFSWPVPSLGHILYTLPSSSMFSTTTWTTGSQASWILWRPVGWLILNTWVPVVRMEVAVGW